MTNLLTISSATKKAYLCLKTPQGEDFCEIDANCSQSENILIQIDKLLAKNELNIGDIDSIAVVVGPGSFTGVRIGVSLVKGFCAGNEKIKVWPLSTFDFMAENVQDDKFVCVINALSGLAFVKEFDRTKEFESEEKMISMTELEAYNCKKIGLMEEDVCQEKILLSPQSLLSLAMKKVALSKPVSPNLLEPVYLRCSQAEENLKKNPKTSENR